MSIHTLTAGTFYILSGLPGVGKSTLLNRSRVPDSFVISSDKLRLQNLGERVMRFDGVRNCSPICGQMGTLIPC